MTANTATDLLIIGAGPFGLAIAAEVERRGIAAIVVGEPMAFWKRHMPRGMFLRSGVDWHLDAAEGWTISRFLEAAGLTATDVRPFPLDVYLDYVEWFAAQASIQAVRGEIVSLDRLGDRGDGFRASLATGDTVTARNVVVAIGFANFARVPAEMAERLPAERVEHTCTAVDLKALAADRCLIVGGRQSAFEWAALLAEAGATSTSPTDTTRRDSPSPTGRGRAQWSNDSFRSRAGSDGSPRPNEKPLPDDSGKKDD